MKRLIMIKYGELTTKKSNRKEIIKLLDNNIEKVLTDINYKITKDRVRMYIETDNIDLVVSKLKKVFGIFGIVVVYQVEKDVEEIKKTLLSLVKDSYKTFKINTKRADKSFEIHSMDFNHMMGSHILKNTNLSVDVHNPDVEFNIEIRIVLIPV